jgi:hypothetical protein
VKARLATMVMVNEVVGKADVCLGRPLLGLYR